MIELFRMKQPRLLFYFILFCLASFIIYWQCHKDAMPLKRIAVTFSYEPFILLDFPNRIEADARNTTRICEATYLCTIYTRVPT